MYSEAEAPSSINAPAVPFLTFFFLAFFFFFLPDFDLISL
jgi:hypothetical protein